MRGMNALQNTQPTGAAPIVPIVGADERGELAHDLMVGLMGAVPVFGGEKVTVGFYGDQAFCSKTLNYVNLPQLPRSLLVPKSIAMEIRGFAAHEAAHMVFTDWAYMEHGLTDEEKKDPLLKEVSNALEDYMIERSWMLIYPGAHKNFTATEVRCCHQYMAQYHKNPDIAKDLRIIGSVALTWCRSVHFGLKTQLSADCLKTMPATLQQRVWDWFWDAIDIETTEDSYNHARKICADIRANPFDPNDPPANPNHNPLQGGAGGAGSGQGGASGGGSQGPGSRGGAAGSGQAGGNQDPAPYQVGHSLSAAYDELKIEAPEHGVSFKVPSNTTAGPMAQALAAAEGVQVSQQVEARVASTTGTVSHVLRRSLQSIARDRWKGGRADGIIDDKRLAQVILGGVEIYKKKVKAPAIDTAVQLLIDCSGSMGGGRLAVCQEVAMVLNQAFNGTPIKFEIIGYTSGDEDHLPDHAKTMAAAIRQQNPANEPDVRSIQLYEFKGFDAPHHVAMTTIGNMQSVDLGGTPTADAIYLAHERLSQRKERRLVMFVLTDGAPDDVVACKEAVEAVEKSDVTTLGIGIQSDAVKHCFTNWAMVAKHDDLAATVLGSLANLIFDDRYKVGLKGIKSPTHVI